MNNNIMKCSKVFSWNLFSFLNPITKIAGNEGGARSSKTYSILQLIINICMRVCHKMYRVSIVSESMPHLKKGAMYDFFQILGDLYDPKKHNRTDNVYELNGHRIEFFSVDKPSALRGSGRDILFINECNNVPYEAFFELEMRTTLFTFLDWNPVSEFWYHERLKGRKDKKGNVDVEHIHSTYQDAKQFLPQKVVDTIEGYKKTDPNRWRVYGLGLVGNLEGLVHPLMQTCQTMPEGKYFYGLDWGYTNDPTAVIRCLIQDKKLYCEQVIYQTGLKTNDVIRLMKQRGVKESEIVFVPHDRPQDRDMIIDAGFNAVKAPTNSGSINSGINLVNEYEQYWTVSSVESINEQRNYQFMKDKTSEKYLNKPIDLHNHSMDARRYAILGYRTLNQPFMYAGDLGMDPTTEKIIDQQIEEMLK